MKTIQEILDVTPKYYEERLVLDSYVLWCDLYSEDDRDCQKLLANGPIFGWWLQEYRRLEDEFRQEVAPYIGKADQKAISQLHLETVIKIRDFYPRSLMQTARKTNIICQLN